MDDKKEPEEEEQEDDASDEDEGSELSTVEAIEQKNAAAKRLEDANTETKRLQDAQAERDQKIALAGKTKAGQPTKKKEETPEEYTESVMAGEYNE